MPSRILYNFSNDRFADMLSTNMTEATMISPAQMWQPMPPKTMHFGQCISSMSLGRAWVHSLEHKLDMAHKYGYKGLELFWEDLEYYTEELYGGNVAENRIKAAQRLRDLCDNRNITIISMQPFYHYEGLRDRNLHAERLKKLDEWFVVAKVLGTDLILIPSNFLPAEELRGDLDDIVADLKQVAQLGLQQTPHIRFCYENLAWGTYVSTWQKCWDVVSRVNLPNFGICLDAFNIAALVYADPTSPTGCTRDCDLAIRKTITELVDTIDPDKIFLLQMVDAEKLKEPLVDGHAFYDASQPARMSWSRNCRLFYGEEGSYLPIKQISEAIIHGLGYRGWISAELFNRRMTDADEVVPEELARRGRDSFRMFERDLQIDVTHPGRPRTGSLTAEAMAGLVQTVKFAKAQAIDMVHSFFASIFGRA